MPDGVAAPITDSKDRILVVDDEPAIVETLQFVLEDAGYRVLTAGSAKDCLEVIARERCDLVLLDLMLPDRPGLEVLEDIGRINRSLPVVMLTAYGTIETAVEATRLGAANFLTKPWNNSKLLLEIEQTLERRRLEAENRSIAEGARTRDSVRKPRREIGGDAEGLCIDPPGRGNQLDCSPLRRERHGQGSCGQGHPQQLPSSRQAVCNSQLRTNPGGIARVDSISAT